MHWRPQFHELVKGLERTEQWFEEFKRVYKCFAVKLLRGASEEDVYRNIERFLSIRLSEDAPDDWLQSPQRRYGSLDLNSFYKIRYNRWPLELEPLNEFRSSLEAPEGLDTFEEEGTLLKEQFQILNDIKEYFHLERTLLFDVCNMSCPKIPHMSQGTMWGFTVRFVGLRPIRGGSGRFVPKICHKTLLPQEGPGVSIGEFFLKLKELCLLKIDEP